VQLLAGKVDAGFIAHPSNVLKEEMEQVRKPLFIAAAGTSRKVAEGVFLAACRIWC
jgi:hypothetical protein